MTTLGTPNVHAVAVDGTFDDCQDLVKAMFADEAFRTRVGLSAVNSINWARVMAQIVYYVWAAQQLDRSDTPTTFCVPTGNFGNVFAGHCARRMGLPIERLLVVEHQRHPHPADSHWHDDRRSRRPDALAEHGHPDLVEPGATPLQLLGANGPATAELLTDFRATGAPRASARAARRVDRRFCRWATRRYRDARRHPRHPDSTGMLVEPTAVGIGVARRLRRVDETVVTLATAHPAKFDAVEQATGVRPLPSHLADLYERTERVTDLPNDLAIVEDFVDSVQ